MRSTRKTGNGLLKPSGRHYHVQEAQMNNWQLLKMYGSVFLLCCIVAAMLTCGAGFAHGAPAVPNRRNSLGIGEYYTNPNIYMFGVMACGGGACAVMQDEKGRKYTNLNFQPYNTMSLYQEVVLFCGDVSGDFGGKSGALVVTYGRVAHGSLRGIGCHELDSVFVVPAPKEAEVLVQ